MTRLLRLWHGSNKKSLYNQPKRETNMNELPKSLNGDRLQGKVAIVTGAGNRGGATGTGYATAFLYAAQGAKVLMVDLDEDRVGETLEVIQKEGGEASIYQADITDEESCNEMAAVCVERYGGIDVLFNNVGTGGRGKVTEVDKAEWDRSLAINLESMVWTCKHTIPHMAASGGGSIINVSSIDGQRAGFSANIPYGAAKAGIIGMTTQMAVHHGRQHIRANVIAPGHLHASFVTHIPEEMRELRRLAGPLGTEGSAWDIAWAAVFLGSDESRWISGQVLNVDGGLFAATPLAMYGTIQAEYGQE